MIRLPIICLAVLLLPLSCGGSSESGADAKSKAQDAVDSAKKALDPKTVGDPQITVDKLKESLNSLSTDNLKEIANNLVTSIKTQSAALKDQLASGKTDAATALKSLKDKLQVVVDKLKASGQDVSQYTAALTG
jgi:hypothetical protein